MKWFVPLTSFFGWMMGVVLCNVVTDVFCFYEQKLNMLKEILFITYDWWEKTASPAWNKPPPDWEETCSCGKRVNQYIYIHAHISISTCVTAGCTFYNTTNMLIFISSNSKRTEWVMHLIRINGWISLRLSTSTISTDQSTSQHP